MSSASPVINSRERPLLIGRTIALGRRYGIYPPRQREERQGRRIIFGQ